MRTALYVSLVLAVAVPPRVGTAEPTDAAFAGTAEAAALPSLSARHVRVHAPSGRQLLAASVDLSPYGLRLRGRERHAALEIVHDFVDGRVWFVDRERAVAHELPLVPDRDAVLVNGRERSGFLGARPCADAPSRDRGAARWRGRAVRAHACLDADGAVEAIELVDTAFGIVVLRRSRDGRVDELRALREREWVREDFVPPSRFRRVDKRELFHGAPALAPFPERRPTDGARFR